MMSEKITYAELVERTAEKAEHSKVFTREFFEYFIDEIRTGLDTDGKVNIARFGKFELQQVDEREGYNPQTQQKMVIPAHQKAVFKPYKELREAVNEPYDHLEPQLIGDEEPAEPTTPSAGESSAKTEADSEKKTPATLAHEQPKQKTSSKKTLPKNYSGWMAAAIAFLATSAGAWFYFKKDE